MKAPSKILGFTVKEIDNATCYLTLKGLKKLRPCIQALGRLRESPKYKFGKGSLLKVDANLFRWAANRELAVEVWLAPSTTTFHGPQRGWPWYMQCDHWDLRSFLRHSFTFQARYVKAFIMKFGKKNH